MLQDTPISPFPQTRWSLITRSTRTEESRRAMGELCEIYWYPIYAWLRKSGHPTHEAQDLTQSFFEHVFEKDLFRKADSARGRLRSFLLKALRYQVSDQQKAVHAAKRGGHHTMISFDEKTAEDRYREERDHDSPDRIFERRWALTVLESAIGRLESSYRNSGTSRLFAALSPFLGWNTRTRPQAEVAKELGMTPGAFRVALNRLRRKFREAVRDEVADTVETEDEIDAEIEVLFQALKT